MTNIKDRIQEIKLSRMGPEYRFVANIFSELETHTTKTKPNHIYFLKDGLPIMVYDKKAHYIWCHNEILWYPLLNMIVFKSDYGNYQTEIKETRKILNHFSLAYFDISNATISMAHSYITDTWITLKFKRVYIW